MKKVLIAYVSKNKNSGINKYLDNITNIIRNNYKDIKFDFLTSDEDDELKEYIEHNGGRLLKISSLKEPLKRYNEIRQIMRKNKYDIVYINISESFNICTALAAKKENIQRIVIHSHGAGPSGNNFFIRLFRICLNFAFKKILSDCGTVLLGCSKKAGIWMFGKKNVKSNRFYVINNTINLSKYEHDIDNRIKYRKKYNINENDIVLGNIGNFLPAKNQIFLLKVLKKLVKKGDYKLILIGSGQLESKFKKYIKKEKIEDKVAFTGPINNVNEVLQAMDIFAFPSTYEGFGIAALEAQAAGLLTILSYKVPEDVIVSYNTIRLPLNEKKWIRYIMNVKKEDIKNIKLMNKIYEFDNSNVKQYEYIMGGNENE